ncbi:hypothetical protein BJ684DRAFT_20962 [Piptocephalis cylindrospora]|uniref:Prefoldin n=1 Tax=Piptocephalis cylindrospora TaxID=1907219 RepID=A0A4P9Y169_9FUNG|nr:hypothetical protein BJ684DRAFT_20962 [Piptocephalis cylindrospora]|eukprot:RKP12505.1 hypothetical protein BJ684DRAFT_20962 [Piptocephalis cylindrospora]
MSTLIDKSSELTQREAPLSSSVLAKHLEPEMRSKVQGYEDFVGERLMPDLAKTEELLQTIRAHLENVQELREKVQGLIENPSSTMETTTDLGQGFLAHASIPDTQWIYVNVGFGFHVQMSLDEAITFTHDQQALLERKEERLAKLADDIKANIQMVYNALAEILQLATPAS